MSRIWQAAQQGPAAVMLANGADHCCAILGSIDPAQAHRLSIDYDGHSRAVVCVDSWCDTIKIRLDSYVVELLCVGVDPGESGRNDVGCSFTNIEIVQPQQPAPPPRRNGARFWRVG